MLLYKSQAHSRAQPRPWKNIFLAPFLVLSVSEIVSLGTELPIQQWVNDLSHVSGRKVIESAVHVVILVLHWCKMNLIHHALCYVHTKITQQTDTLIFHHRHLNRSTLLIATDTTVTSRNWMLLLWTKYSCNSKIVSWKGYDINSSDLSNLHS